MLDTNALLWFVTGDKRFGQKAKRLIHQANTISFSSISILELEIKRAIGKLSLPTNFGEQLTEQGFVEIPFKASHAEFINEFQTLSSHDPFDRAILASAKAEGLILLTSDEKLLSLGLPFVIDSQE